LPSKSGLAGIAPSLCWLAANQSSSFLIAVFADGVETRSVIPVTASSPM